MAKTNYPIFSVYGIEMEYMIVDQASLAIKPLADKLIGTIAGEITNEVICGELVITNELALHVVELTTNGPKKSLKNLDLVFHERIIELNKLLQASGAKLMPTGTHPFFIPDQNVALWPHGDQIIYQTYNKIFNCSGHGWTNLQSVHINLPFSNDDELKKLHSAIRLILPLIPALAASTPFSEGKLSDALDSRLLHYGQNQKLLPIISGDIIPEFIQSEKEYHEKILNPMYHAIAPHDPEKILQQEWLNSRGAIVRFDRYAVEIRIMDIQESPLMDISCISAITAAIKHIIQHQSLYLEKPLATQRLKQIYQDAIYHGMSTLVTDQEYLAQLGLKPQNAMSMQVIWQKLIELSASEIDPRHQKGLDFILKHGNLAERLKKHYQSEPREKTITHLFNQLCESLETNGTFQ